MDASEIYSKRLSAKEVIFPKEKGEFIFPIADGRIKTLGGDLDLRTSTLVRHRPFQGEGNQELGTSTLIRERPIRGESHVHILGESEGSLPPPQDSFLDAGEAINSFGPCQETSFSAITLNPESNFTRREKNHSLFH